MALISQSQRPPPNAASSLVTFPLRKLKFLALGTMCEAKFSRFRPTSLVSRINAAAGISWVEVDEEMNQLLALCDTLYAMTRGVLDPTALPLIHLWNWKAEQPVIPTADRIAAARRLVGWTKVQRTPGKIFLPEAGMALDFGGFGKEYAVDLVAQIAVNHGISNVLVDFGHDLRALGAPPGRPAWHIGLEDPKAPGKLAGSIGVTDKGVASSGDYVRCFMIEGRRYGHIIDPRTGWPVDNGCTQVTVLAGTCLQAGVLSTTAFVLGLQEGLGFIQAFPAAEGLLISEQSRAQTRGFFNYVASP